MNRGSGVRAARIVLPIVAAIAVGACQRGRGMVDDRQTAVARTAPVDGRIRYRAGARPVFLAPDGSRHPLGSLLAVPGRMAFGEFVWNERGSGTGPIWVRVDLPRQLISVFRGEDEIGTAVIVYGSDGKATPTGTFRLLGKERMHRSVAYRADMPFTMWLTHDGVALHASTVERGRATHGCVGLPLAFAHNLFNVAMKGDVAYVLPAPSSGDI